jgi:hypothetical protein
VAARDEAALFDVAEVAAESSGEPPSATSWPKRAGQAALATLGSRVVASPRLAAQRQIVRRAPTDTSVAALLDALSAAAGRLTLTQAARLLNVDGYAVLRVIDEGRTVELNLPLLRQQFLDI